MSRQCEGWSFINALRTSLCTIRGLHSQFDRIVTQSSKLLSAQGNPRIVPIHTLCVASEAKGRYCFLFVCLCVCVCVCVCVAAPASSAAEPHGTW